MSREPGINSNSEQSITKEFESQHEIKVEENIFIDAEPISDPDSTRSITGQMPTEYDPKLQLDREVDDRIRVLRKEIASKLGLEFLEKIKLIMDKDVAIFPQWEGWLDKAAIISAQSGIPRILVGLLGCTGAGKSSLISAFVEEKSIVPSCSFRATTAVAVEVAWNPSNDPESAYRAEVEFISSQEWLDEVNFLLREIKARPDGEELKVGSTSDAGIAYSKVAAIYPDVSSLPLKKITASRLNKTRDLSIVLGSTIHIQGSSAKRLSELIKKYIVSDNQGSQDGVNYWPLVRVVRIFTKADDLKTGLVLVDLPGLGDSNAARANVCQKYLQNLNHLWIVADIARAVDSKIAKDLMGQKFQRQLCLDGRYDDNFITFIMTHMDILPTQSVIEDLQLEGQVLKSEFQEEARLKDIKKRVEEKLQSMKQIRKRKRDEGENKHLSNGKELKRELKEVTKALTKLNNVIKARCIKERNAWVQDHIQMDFQNGLNELRQDMEDENNTTPLSLNSQGGLRTFCVSTTAYQQLQGRVERENPSNDFSTLEQTNIPMLKEFAQNCTLRGRERVADKIITDLNVLRVSVRQWAEGKDTSPLSISQMESLDNGLEKHYKELQKVTFTICKTTMANIRKAIKIQVDASLEKAVEAARLVANAEAKKIVSEPIAASTWKAICRRSGTPYIRANKTHDWVDAFTKSFTKSFAMLWKHIFEEKLPEIHQRFAAAIIDSLIQFQKDLMNLSEGLREYHAPMQHLLAQIPLLGDQVRERVAEALEYSEKSAKDANRLVDPSILSAMKPLYNELTEITGIGMLKKSKKVFQDFINVEASKFYTDAREHILNALKKMCASLSRKFSAVANDMAEKLYNDIKDMLTIMGSEIDVPLWIEKRKAVLQFEVMSALKDLDEAWAKEVENPNIYLRAADPFREHGKIGDLESVDDSDSDLFSDSDDSNDSDEDYNNMDD